MLWAMNLHVLHRPSLQRVIFGGEEGGEEGEGLDVHQYTPQSICDLIRIILTMNNF